MITEQQKIERLLGIGGSDMPIIMELSSYKTPYQLYLEKIGSTEISYEMTEAQYWGHKHEPTIRKEFEERHHVTVETPDTLIHPDYSFLRGNLDGFIPSYNAVLEIKTHSEFAASEWGAEGTNAIPRAYLVQVAHYCIITNADCAYIAVLIGNGKYREYKYTRDAEFENRILNAAKDFWNCVQTKTPPKLKDEHDVRLMFPIHEEDKQVIASNEIEKQFTNLTETRFQLKMLGDVEEKYKFNIMKHMKDAEALVDNSGQILATFKTNKRGSRTFLIKGLH